MAVNKAGKYTKLTKDTINKLEQVFAMDGPITEACFYANIRTQTYYNWIEKNPAMKIRFDELRNKPMLKARQRIMKGIDESYGNAMDYAKRKKKLEFGDNVDLTSGGQKIESNKIIYQDFKDGTKSK